MRFAISIAAGCVAVTLLTGCSQSPKSKRDKQFAIGRQRLEKKDYPRAILEFQNAIQAMPDDAEAHYQLGEALSESGDVQHAYEELSLAVRLNPQHQAARLKLAEIKAAAGDLQAVQESQSELKALAGTAATPSILNALALTQLKLGETGDATQTLKEALKLSPRELNSSVMLAITKLSVNDAAGAEEALKAACLSAPNAAEPPQALAEFYTSTIMPTLA